MSTFRVKPLFHLFQDLAEIFKGYTPAMLVEDFHKAAHMSPFVVSGQADIHVYFRNRLLLTHILIAHRDGVTDAFYSHLIDIYITEILMVLNIFHGFFLTVESKNAIIDSA
jgi:hypothetical protein